MIVKTRRASEYGDMRAVDESIAIKDIIHYHREQFNISLEDCLNKFEVPKESTQVEDDVLYINIACVNPDVKNRWLEEKKRIKEIRFNKKMSLT